MLSWINNNVRSNGIDERIGSVERRLGEHDRRFDELKDDYVKRFDDLRSASHKDALEILRAMTASHERIAVVETRQNA